MPPSRNQTTWRRYAPELIVAVLGLIVVVAIWASRQGDDGAATRPTATTGTTATTEAAAPEGTTPLIEDEGRTAEGDATAAGSLKDAVLRRSDLPSGWSPTAVSSGGSALCAGHDPTASSTAAVRAGFRKDPGTRLLAASVAAYRSAEAAAAVVQKASQDAAACSGSGVTYTASALSGIGDEAVRVERTVQVGGKATLRSVALVARSGARVAIVSISGDPVETDVALAALRAEVDRLEG
jgi:hypothetical protein